MSSFAAATTPDGGAELCEWVSIKVYRINSTGLLLVWWVHLPFVDDMQEWSQHLYETVDNAEHARPSGGCRIGLRHLWINGTLAQST